MTQDSSQLSKAPTPDKAEDNAFFPSPYSLSQYTAPKTDFNGVNHKNAYTGGKWKVLMIAAEERYVLLENGKMFSTGNHPVEMLLPLHHLMEAGFDVDVATLTGYPVKLEHWAMPTEDEAVQETYNKLKEKYYLKLSKMNLVLILIIFHSSSLVDMLLLLVFLKVKMFNKL